MKLTMSEATVIRIKTLCRERGISISQLAELSNLSQSTLNEILQGRSKHPTSLTIKKIADGLGMKLSEFYDDPIFDQVTYD